MVLRTLSPGVQLRVRKDWHSRDARSKTVPIRHMLSSKFNEHAFIYLSLTKRVHKLLHTSELFDQQSSSVRNGFKVTSI